MKHNFANNLTTYLSRRAYIADTVLGLGSTEGIPEVNEDLHFYCTLESVTGAIEIVRVVEVIGNDVRVERGVDGTAAQEFAPLTPVQGRLVRVILQNFLQEDDRTVVRSNRNGFIFGSLTVLGGFIGDGSNLTGIVARGVSVAAGIDNPTVTGTDVQTVLEQQETKIIYGGSY